MSTSNSVSPSDSARIYLATCVRIASLAIGGYDYVLTLPAEWRIYKRQRSFRISGILFFLIRYVSVLTLAVGSWTWFYTGFTEKQCHRVYLITAIFRGLQLTVSQAIMGWRTCNMAQRRKEVVCLILISFVCACTAEWFTNLYSRRMSQIGGRCRAISPGNNPIVWVFYLCALLYDFLLLVISSWFLYNMAPTSRLMIKLKRMMLVDGLVYFVLVAATNIINIFVFHAIDENDIAQAAALPAGAVATWIMTQRILIHLNETSLKQKREEAITETVTNTLSRHPRLSAQSIEEISQEVRSQFRSMSEYEHENKDDGKVDNVYDYMSSASSSQRNGTGSRRRARTRVNPTDSDCFLDTIVGVDVDISIEPTVVAGRRTRSEDEFHRDVGGEGSVEKSASNEGYDYRR